jgi:tRNA dimethylallyltransferase
MIPPVFIAGPTAAGKSEIALQVAEKIGGEIISVDSMQVYRGLDIGTAKPLAVERDRVPHHLLDICGLHETFDAAQFVRRAQTAVAEIQSRGKVPVFCGGTGLYFKAFLEGLGEAPPGDAALRVQLEALPLELLLTELREGDPVAFEKIDRKNPRRVIRAVEVLRLTGRAFSVQKADWQSGTQGSPTEKFFVLTRAVDDLRHRINRRVDRMFERGLLEETRQLLSQGLGENKFAMQAIGYRQAVEHLHGDCSLAQAVEQVKIRTRQFAKRQMTWFRAQPGVVWMELKPDADPVVIAQTIARP